MIFQGNTTEVFAIARTKVPMQWYSTKENDVENHGSYWIDIPQNWIEESVEEYLWRFSNSNYLFRIAP
jgi:hypothetical protein